MSSDVSVNAATGGLLLCRAEAASVAPAAHLLRRRMLLAPAGPEWTVLVPEEKPWLENGEPVDRVLAGWAAALAVGATWPVLALWWDEERGGLSLASGFRRPVGYVWLANGTPVGEDEAMRSFAVRLGLDPVHDMQALETLTRPEAETDARSRMLALLAVLTRTGLALPVGLGPGVSADRLASVARVHPDVEQISWSGWRDAVRAELDIVEGSRLGPWMVGPKARVVAGVQLAAGVPLALWGVRRRSGGWTTAGAVLIAQGAAGVAYNRLRAGSTGGVTRGSGRSGGC